MKINKWLIAGFGLVVSAVFLWFAFRNLNPAAVWEHIRQINVLWLLLAGSVYCIIVILISTRSQFMFRSIKLIPIRQLAPLICIGYMGNNVYPFRGGDVLRIILLQHNHQIPIARGAMVVVLERVFDGIIMLSFIVVSLLFVQTNSPEVQQVAQVAAPIFLSAITVFFVLAARPNLLRRLVSLLSSILPGRLRQLAQSISEEIIGGLEGLRSPANLFGAIFFTYASWMVEASIYWIISIAFGLNLGYPVMLLTLGVVNLAGLIPASPGMVGVFEFFVGAVLMSVGVDKLHAQSFSVVIHLVIWLPVTIAGFIFLTRQGLSWSSITRARELEQTTS